MHGHMEVKLILLYYIDMGLDIFLTDKGHPGAAEIHENQN